MERDEPGQAAQATPHRSPKQSFLSLLTLGEHRRGMQVPCKDPGRLVHKHQKEYLNSGSLDPKSVAYAHVTYLTDQSFQTDEVTEFWEPLQAGAKELNRNARCKRKPFQHPSC